MRQSTAKVLAGTFLVGLVCNSISNHIRNHQAGSDPKGQERSLLFGWGSKSKYNGQKGNEYCYNVNVADGTLCCDRAYDSEEENNGFGKSAVCYLENSFNCKDLKQAIFVEDGEITMDPAMIGKRAFPNIVTGDGFRIDNDPSKGKDKAPYDYSIKRGFQNGLFTELTGNAAELPEKSFLVSGWDESQAPSDHEIEWAGPSTIGLGGESFASPAVILKGGKGAMVYLDDRDPVLHGAGIRTPIDPEVGVNAKTDHVEFCFDFAPALTVDSSVLFRDGDPTSDNDKNNVMPGGKECPAGGCDNTSGSGSGTQSRSSGNGKGPGMTRGKEYKSLFRDKDDKENKGKDDKKGKDEEEGSKKDKKEEGEDGTKKDNSKEEEGSKKEKKEEAEDGAKKDDSKEEGGSKKDKKEEAEDGAKKDDSGEEEGPKKDKKKEAEDGTKNDDSGEEEGSKKEKKEEAEDGAKKDDSKEEGSKKDKKEEAEDGAKKDDSGEEEGSKKDKKEEAEVDAKKDHSKEEESSKKDKQEEAEDGAKKDNSKEEEGSKKDKKEEAEDGAKKDDSKEEEGSKKDKKEEAEDGAKKDDSKEEEGSKKDKKKEAEDGAKKGDSGEDAAKKEMKQEGDSGGKKEEKKKEEEDEAKKLEKKKDEKEEGAKKEKKEEEGGGKCNKKYMNVEETFEMTLSGDTEELTNEFLVDTLLSASKSVESASSCSPKIIKVSIQSRTTDQSENGGERDGEAMADQENGKLASPTRDKNGDAAADQEDDESFTETITKWINSIFGGSDEKEETTDSSNATEASSGGATEKAGSQQRGRRVLKEEKIVFTLEASEVERGDIRDPTYTEALLESVTEITEPLGVSAVGVEGTGGLPTEDEDIPPPPPPEEDDETEGDNKEEKKTQPGIKGDPHIKKWDGIQYDFHGGCDLVMLQNPDFNNGQGLYIHIRTKIEHWWSYIESAVIMIGTDSLEVKGGVEERRYWVNGKEGHRFRASRNLPFTIGGFRGRFRAINSILTQFKLYLPNDQNVVIKSAKYMLRVDVENCSAEDFGNSLGLMGTFGEGVMMARDNRTVMKDPTEFGMEWQVLNTEPQLFHDVVGPQHPQKCAMPTTKTFLRRQRAERASRRMLVESLSREEAKPACARASRDEFEDCVYDVMATNDKDVASAYA